MSSQMQCGCLSSLVIDNVLCSFIYFTSISNFKAIGQLLIIWRYFILKIWGILCRLAASAVVLVKFQ